MELASYQEEWRLVNLGPGKFFRKVNSTYRVFNTSSSSGTILRG
jgi:hypothetical protein